MQSIPDKQPSNPLHVEIKYKDAPDINLKPIRFQSSEIGQRASYLHPYSEFNEIWLLANHVANNIPVSTNHASTHDNVPFASNDGDVESDVKESSTSTSGILDDTILQHGGLLKSGVN